MVVLNRNSFLLSSLLLFIAASNCLGYGTDLPAKLQDDLDRGKTRFEEEIKTADEALRQSFDKAVNSARSLPKLSAEERRQMIDSIEAEKAIFEKLGHVPFSSVMRVDTVSYLNRIQKAEIAISKLYDRAIEYHTMHKNDESARLLVAEKKRAIEPKVVAKWIETHPKNVTGTATLLSNGMLQEPKRVASWTLDKKQLVISLKDKNAPGGAWIDSWTISANGMQAEARNQKGYSYTAKRLIAD